MSSTMRRLNSRFSEESKNHRQALTNSSFRRCANQREISGKKKYLRQIGLLKRSNKWRHEQAKHTFRHLAWTKLLSKAKMWHRSPHQRRKELMMLHWLSKNSQTVFCFRMMHRTVTHTLYLTLRWSFTNLTTALIAFSNRVMRRQK